VKKSSVDLSPVAIAAYRQRFPLPRPWHLDGCANGGFAGAVVIPALAESAELFATLATLAGNPAELLRRFLIVVVVNHRADASAAEQADNHATLRRLAGGDGVAPGLALAWVDVATPGRELPEGDGVGLARKIGFDLALERLAKTERPLLVALDADTHVEATYLAALRAHFAASGAGATVIPFGHRPAVDAQQAAAILRYELFLRHYVLGLRLAGSPYAYHSIGSACACTAAAYLKAGGMNRRQAGEDFYFLQQLAKTSGLEVLHGTTVHPSSRRSGRVPFGTGRSMTRQHSEGATAVRFYPVAAFRILADWLALAQAEEGDDGGALLARAAALAPELGVFLAEAGLERVWPRLRHQHRTAATFSAAFHGWFDGFKTLRLIHTLCQEALPPVDVDVALTGLAAWGKMPPAHDQHGWLQLLRCTEAGSCPSGEGEEVEAEQVSRVKVS
jgi:hypothetical protein